MRFTASAVRRLDRAQGRAWHPQLISDAVQSQAFCTLSDSGTITEEASVLGIPAITIRQAHARPEGMDVGRLIMPGLQAQRVLEAIEVVRRHCDAGRRFRPAPDYEANDVSAKVVRIILGYADYVNRTVWMKR